VAQALPTYIMSVINIPLLLCDSLTSIIRDFWWVVEKGNRKTAWVAWRDLTEENFTVDMVLEMRIFNQALLACRSGVEAYRSSG
jgi:hypothetical protein